MWAKWYNTDRTFLVSTAIETSGMVIDVSAAVVAEMICLPESGGANELMSTLSWLPRAHFTCNFPIRNDSIKV